MKECQSEKVKDFFFFFLQKRRESSLDPAARSSSACLLKFLDVSEKTLDTSRIRFKKKKKKRKKRKWQAYSLEIRFRREEKRKKWERERHFYFEQSVPVFINKNHDNQRAITRPSTKKVMQKKKKKGGTLQVKISIPYLSIPFNNRFGLLPQKRG